MGPSRSGMKSRRDQGKGMMETKSFERLGLVSSPGPSGQRRCHSPAHQRPSSPSLDVKTEFDCELSLLEQRVQFDLSYAEQRWDRSKVSGLGEVLKYVNSQNKLARSSGRIDILGDQLGVDFELNHSNLVSEQKIDPGSQATMDIAGKVAVEGTQEKLKYWVSYEYFGAEFSDRVRSTPRDRSGGKIGAELTLGPFTPRVELAQHSDNVSSDPNESQTSLSRGKLSIIAHAENWPLLTLTYGRDLKARVEKPGGPLDEEKTTDSFSGSLWYGRSNWDTYATSSYFVTEDEIQKETGSKTFYHALGGSYRPVDGLSLSPSLEFTQTYAGEAEYRTESLSANLGVDYYTSDGSLTGFAYGSFVTNQDSEGYVGDQSVSVALGLEKDLAGLIAIPHAKQSLLLRFDHYRYIDLVYSTSGLATYSALLLFKIAP